MDINTLHPVTFIGKIVSASKERLCFHMPHFYNHDDSKFGKVTVIPKGIRHVRVFGYSPVPYVTMSEIRFTLNVEKFPRSDYNVYMQLGDGSYRTIETLSKNKTPISGVAMYTGDTKFFIAPVAYTDKSSERFIAREGLLLFEDNIISINNYVWGGCSVTALLLIIFGTLLGLISGLIQVTPERVIWWPW
jgi:hypothetical protein